MRAPILAGALLVVACQNGPDKGPVVVPPAPLVCPASATAAIPPRPAGPALTAQQREDLDVAVITVLGEETGEAVLRAEAAGDAWAAALVRRIEDMARFCRENASPPT